MSRIAYVNGRYLPQGEARVHICDRGYQFADSVYEVFAFIGGTVADGRGHMDRLERSLGILGIPMPMSRRALALVLREVARRNRLDNAQLYLQITRGVAPRSFVIPEGIRPSVVITARPMSFDIEARKEIAKKAITLPDIRWARRDVKTTMLLPASLALRQAREKGAQEAWFVDPDGFVTEATACNAWIVDKKGALVTRPAAGNHILKGVTGVALRALCKKEKIKVVERAFTPREAYAAREAFTSSANMLFVPIVEIDGHKIGDGKPGPVTKRLLDLYFGYVKKGKQEKWKPD